MKIKNVYKFILTYLISFTLGVITVPVQAAFYEQIDNQQKMMGQSPLLDNSLQKSFDYSDLRQLQIKKNKSNFYYLVNLIRQNKLLEAEKELKRFLKQNPNISIFYDVQGLLYQVKNKPVLAQQSYEHALKITPKDYLAYMGLSKLALDDKKIMQARDYAIKANLLNEGALQPYFLLLEIALQNNNSNEIDKILKTALTKLKNNQLFERRVITQWGSYYVSRKQPEKFLELAKKFSKKYPNDYNGSMLLAEVYSSIGQKKQAIQILRSLVKRNKQEVKVRILLAQLLSEKTDTEKEVLGLFDNALEIKPKDSNLYLLKANYLIKIGKIHAAFKVSQQLNKSNPGSVIRNIIQGNAYRADKKFEQAIAAYEIAYIAQPNNSLLFVLSDLLYKQGNSKKAIQFLKQVIKKEPENLPVHYYLASRYQQSNDFINAIKYYDAILNKTPDNVIVLNNIAWLYEQQDLSKALIYAQKAVQKAPDSPDILDTLGYILLKQKRAIESVEILEKALSLSPDTPVIQYHLALAYKEANDLKKAKNILENLVNSKNNFSELNEAKKILQEIIRAEGR